MNFWSWASLKYTVISGRFHIKLCFTSLQMQHSFFFQSPSTWEVLFIETLSLVVMIPLTFLYINCYLPKFNVQSFFGCMSHFFSYSITYLLKWHNNCILKETLECYEGRSWPEGRMFLTTPGLEQFFFFLLQLILVKKKKINKRVLQNGNRQKDARK